jgi:hypothetical protein
LDRPVPRPLRNRLQPEDEILAAKQAEASLKRYEGAQASEMLLDYMLRVMRDPVVDPARRDVMARSAAAYCHPQLQAIAHKLADEKGNPQLELLTILAAAFVKLAIEFAATAPSAILETGNGRRNRIPTPPPLSPTPIRRQIPGRMHRIPATSIISTRLHGKQHK